MSLVNSLIQFFQQPRAETTDKSPDELCPNCWGSQQYDNVIREMYVDKQIDVNNHEANHAFIQDFVVNRIDGIRLKKGNSGYECPTCRLIHQPND